MAATEETVLARQLRSNACIVSTACSLPDSAPATCSMYLQHGRQPDVSPHARHTAHCSIVNKRALLFHTLAMHQTPTPVAALMSCRLWTMYVVLYSHIMLNLGMAIMTCILLCKRSPLRLVAALSWMHGCT